MGGKFDKDPYFNQKRARRILTGVLLMHVALIAVPLAVRLAARLLEAYPYRISGYGWIFAVAVAISLMISFAAVLWQALKAARTNPAIELKKE